MDYNAKLMNAPNADLLLAQQWLARLAEQAGGRSMGPAELPLPMRWVDAAASLVALALAEGKQIQIVVPDDDTLPALSNALDIDLRPLCLILPEADFATRIALRATLTLLRSRLTRHADTHPIWEAQRRRMTQLQGLWESVQAWGRSESEAHWPDDIAQLFPARLLPASQALAFAAPSDLLLLIAPERMQAEHRDTLVSIAPYLLCLSASTRGAERRRLVVFDTEARQRYELDVLTQEIAELELELATAQAEIADFSQRYHAVTGRLMVELDALQAAIAAHVAAQQPDDSTLQEAAANSQAQAERSQQEQQRFEEAPNKERATATPDAKPFAPSQDLKKLYRQIAQKIHPDRASSEAERDWRTQLMSEATRAYRNEDAAALREVLSLWQEGPGSTASTSPTSALDTQLKRMKARLAEIQSELDRLLASRLYELFVAARIAQRQGRDLLQEMANQIELQIEGARLQLKSLQADNSQPENAP